MNLDEKQQRKAATKSSDEKQPRSVAFFHVLDVLPQAIQLVRGSLELEHILNPLEQLDLIDRFAEKVIRTS